MEIIVCIKQVPDTETRIKIKSGSTNIDYEGVKMVLNPYDEYAVEEAIQIKERIQGSTITVISIGPAKVRESIITALAMGADKAIHIDDPIFDGGDSYSTAKALSKVISTIPYNIILCGKQAIDDDMAGIGPAIAEFLNIPSITVITKLEISPDCKTAKAYMEMDSAIGIVETSLPAVFTAQKGLNTPRYASLPNIMKAKKKEIKVMKLADIGLTANDVGKTGAKTNIIELSYPPSRKAGRIIQGEPEIAVKELVKLLHEEAKVI